MLASRVVPARARARLQFAAPPAGSYRMTSPGHPELEGEIRFADDGARAISIRVPESEHRFERLGVSGWSEAARRVADASRPRRPRRPGDARVSLQPAQSRSRARADRAPAAQPHSPPSRSRDDRHCRHLQPSESQHGTRLPHRGLVAPTRPLPHPVGCRLHVRGDRLPRRTSPALGVPTSLASTRRIRRGNSRARGERARSNKRRSPRTIVLHGVVRSADSTCGCRGPDLPPAARHRAGRATAIAPVASRVCCPCSSRA